MNHFGVDQLLHQLVTQTFNLNRPSLRKMQNRLLALGAAKQPPGAAVVGLVFFTHGRAATHRALARHGELRGIDHPFVQQDRDHFGNHVTGAAHHHGVAHPHVLAPGFVFVVQRGIGYRDTAHKHRCQFGHGCEFAGAPDLHLNAEHGGELLLRRKLVGHSPARLAGHKTHAALQFQAVNFVHHTVNVKPQALALFANPLIKRYQFSSALRRLYKG